MERTLALTPDMTERLREAVARGAYETVDDAMRQALIDWEIAEAHRERSRGELREAFPDIWATTVLPGVVSTDFGKNALHGGVDNAKLPGAQPVGEVAEVIANVIEKPRAEVYTRPQMRELAEKYFSAEDVSEIEKSFGRPPPR